MTTLSIEQCQFRYEAEDHDRSAHFKTNPNLAVELKLGGNDAALGKYASASHILVTLDVDGEDYDLVQVDAPLREDVRAMRRAIAALQIIVDGIDRAEAL